MLRDENKNVETIAIEFWVDLEGGALKLERLEIPIPFGSGPYAQAAAIQGLQGKFFEPMGRSPFAEGTALEIAERNVTEWASQFPSPSRILV